MKVRTTTAVLSGLLALSLLGNVLQGLQTAFGGVGKFYDDMYRGYEVSQLRDFGVRVAAGEAPRAVLTELSGPVSEADGWLDNLTLRAKFDGDRLVKLCSSKHVLSDNCSEDPK